MSCQYCKHIFKNPKEEPCNTCIHNATDNFERAKTITVAELIKELQKMANQMQGIPMHYTVEMVLKGGTI